MEGMPHRQIIWDRTKLYDELREKPTVQVAKDYGISDVGLGKVCRQLSGDAKKWGSPSSGSHSIRWKSFRA